MISCLNNHGRFEPYRLQWINCLQVLCSSHVGHIFNNLNFNKIEDGRIITAPNKLFIRTFCFSRDKLFRFFETTTKSSYKILLRGQCNSKTKKNRIGHAVLVLNEHSATYLKMSHYSCFQSCQAMLGYLRSD